jgi:hypothetical protein
MEPLLQHTPSNMGTTKAASMWRSAVDDMHTTLFVSVRGTASRADHTVNLNGEPKDLGPFCVSCLPHELLSISPWSVIGC